MLLAAGGNPAIRLYDTISATRTPEQHISASITPTANILPIHVFEGHQGNVLAVGFHADCKWMWMVSESGELRLWDLQDEFACIKEIAVGPATTTAVLHPAQEEVLVGDEMGNIRFWNLASGQCIGEIKGRERVAIRDVAVSPDGMLIAALDHRGCLRVWKVSNLVRIAEKASYEVSLLGSVDAHLKYGIKCQFSPDSTMLLTTSADATAKLWTIDCNSTEPTLVLTQEFLGHTKWVWDCAFSADSAYVITASSDESVRLWDAASGAMIAIYVGHSKAVTCIALNDFPVL